MTTDNFDESSIEESPELLKLRSAKEARIAGLEKARAVRSANIEARKASDYAGEPEKIASDKAIWLKLFFTFMHTCEIKGTRDVPAMIERADDAMELLHAAGKL